MGFAPVITILAATTEMSPTHIQLESRSLLWSEERQVTR